MMIWAGPASGGLLCGDQEALCLAGSPPCAYPTLLGDVSHPVSLAEGNRTFLPSSSPDSSLDNCHNIFQRFRGAGIHSPGTGPPRGHLPPRCWGGLMRVPDARDPFRAPLPPLLPVGAYRRTRGGPFLLDAPRGPRPLFFRSSCACAVPLQPQALKTDRQGLLHGFALISAVPEFCPGLRHLLLRPAFS